MFIGASHNFAKAGAPKSKIISSLKPHNIKIEQFWPVAHLHSAMAATMAKFPLLGYFGGKKQLQKRRDFSIAAQRSEVQESQEKAEEEERESVRTEKVLGTGGTPLRPVEKQVNVESKNMGREYGGDWLSSATRHVRIYAAYIDPETCAFDQTQMDKLTIILDPTNEFVWTSESCNKVYSYFQELVDHYEGAPLTEYTLRLIGSDIEHYIRKLLYDGEIKYNMDARVLNFSMGKPRMMFNNNDIQTQDVQQP